MAELNEASSSASASVSSNFDVFLNFRGEDTRKNFTGFLHKALKNSGINVFFDSEKLWVGEAIGPALLRAIEGSKISIPVFSKGYASSKWCLLELSQIHHFHTTNGQMVLPIFFDVEPSHVRNQTGSFEGPVQEHEKNFKPHIVESWREALRMVGNLKGWVLKEDANGDQADLVELVVKRVWGALISSTFLAECKYPIGIDSCVNELLPLLNIGSNDVQSLGICGFGGIGKTTIAKALYNRIHPNFNRHSFLSDVREQATQRRGLATLQKRLLKDIFKVDIDIADYHRGKTMIKERLCKENVLLVLDDVDNQEQLSALASELNWSGQESRVIITTRDEHILNMAKVDGDKLYWPQVLDHNQSLQLFSFHAFSRGQPPEDYMQLSQDVVCYSGGLPLTLEVLGSYLSEISNKDIWESTLQKLKDIPHEKVQRRLKISYDNLEDDYQKAIFLDVACFFIGWEKQTVIFIWEACGYHPKSSIYILFKRSLLKFQGNFLRMHDQIRDMGRKIVLEESLMEPGTDMIKGIMLPYAFVPINLDSEQFEMMHNLRYLDISLANFTGDFSLLPSGLIWFKWIGRHWGTILPTNFYHRRLVNLDLSDSMIKQAWNMEPQDENKRFQKLKLLNLRRCRYLSKSPKFSWFPYLERLDLECCDSLDKLDESIGQLTQLKSLILCMCQQIKELPKSIGNLKSLVKLDLSWIEKMEELPHSISRLSSLKELNLQSCVSLKKLPEKIGDLKSLVKLDLSRTKKIEELPDNISWLSSLKELNMQSCVSLNKLPESIGDLKSLVMLDLSWIEKIEELPHNISRLSSLKELNLQSCVSLNKLPESIGDLRSLAKLDLLWTEAMKELLDNISRLSSLKELNLRSCLSLKKLPESLGDLKSLVKLDLFSTKIEELPNNISMLSSLKDLDLESCDSLKKLPNGVGLLEKLEVLNAMDFGKLVQLPRSMGRMKCLRSIDLRGTQISKLPDDISLLSSLEVLTGNARLKTLPIDLLATFKNLE
ncbi:disease resistance protein RUN1-like [Macadamia integrifolia]|uniref:disease resistance protein RUN1-like n=1 Tax=Macadamia integrifolia TaxID=60698 RepID=UPI001C52DE4A|nr:disease resistance protein RUN1-like [Macadamia integrifolia]